MKRFGWLVAAALGLTACVPAFVEQNDSQVILRITKIASEAGEEQEEGDFLLSDVQPVFNDNALVTLQVLPKNPNLATAAFSDVYIERYEVRYFRTDGRNQEGVDVPFRFTGPLGTQIPFNSTGQVAFIVVRHTAKEEPPLRNLRFVGGVAVGGGLDILTCVAEITIHGRTTSGQAVTATGRLQVTFADFADAAATPTPTSGSITSPSGL